MRSADAPGDLTARARIRDAALLLFAREGFRATVRAVAEEAGVSPGLVIHHFRSKDGLRQACDAHVLAVVRESKSTVLGDEAGYRSDPSALLAQLAGMDAYGPLLGYLLRSLQAGGDLARELVDHMVDDARAYLADAVRSGAVRPSHDDAARARYLVTQSLGTLLLDATLHPADDPAGVLDGYLARHGLPAVELYTQGFLTDATLLDTYLEYRSTTSDPGEDR